MSDIDNERIRKLLALALDPAAASGEIDNAGRMLIGHLRKAGARPEDLLAGAARVVVQERVVYRDRPAPDIRMPFGKHRGVPVADIDPGYLQWVLDNCDNIAPYLEAEIRRVLRLEEEG